MITICSALQIFVTNPVELFALRLAIGFALGGDYAVGVSLLAEIAPKKERGVLLGALSVVWTIGYVIANVIGVALTSFSDPNIWRWMLASAAIPAFVVLMYRIGTPAVTKMAYDQGS